MVSEKTAPASQSSATEIGQYREQNRNQYLEEFDFYLAFWIQGSGKKGPQDLFSTPAQLIRLDEEPKGSSTVNQPLC